MTNYKFVENISVQIFIPTKIFILKAYRGDNPDLRKVTETPGKVSKLNKGTIGEMTRTIILIIVFTRSVRCLHSAQILYHP
jgi:hypothetical protein